MFCSLIDQALSLARSFNKEIYIIGGAQVYRDTIRIADRLEITEVKQTVDGDSFFPEYRHGKWTCVSRTPGEYYDFATYIPS